jgi:hypothetical protein
MHRQFVAFAKKTFDSFLRQVTVARADIDDERIRSARRARQRLAELGVNRLTNHVFDDGAMWCGCSDSHKI